MLVLGITVASVLMQSDAERTLQSSVLAQAVNIRAAAAMSAWQRSDLPIYLTMLELPHLVLKPKFLANALIKALNKSSFRLSVVIKSPDDFGPYPNRYTTGMAGSPLLVLGS
jgi:hypothetical protein